VRILPAFIRSVAAAVIGCLLLAPVALAAGGGESTPLNLPSSDSTAKSAPSVGPGGGSIVRTIVGLAVVIGVIYGLHWILKQVKASKQTSASGTGLEDLATLPLGTNRSLHLVRAGSEIVLVGVGEAGVTPIRTYGEHEARALGLLVDDEAAAPDILELPAETVRPSFLEALRRKTVLK
jgi:flagellar protein FliO/FliZ